MTATVKLFMHGHRQAVCSRNEFRFGGNEVRVSNVGNRVILEPLVRAESDVAAVWAEIDALRNGEELFLDGGFDNSPARADRCKFVD